MTEFKLAEIEDVEKQIKDTQLEYNYRIIDYSIGELLKKFRLESELPNLNNEEHNVLIVPSYQRKFIWVELMQSKFVESIFMGVPIQPLFAFQLDDDGNMELLDGVQRLSSIRAFYKNELTLKGLEELDLLNGYTFENLENSRKRKFLNTVLKFYVINENTDEGVRADIFRRVNEGGTKLEPAEIRKGKFNGNEFYDFILECTKLPEFKKLYSSTKEDDKLRGAKEELISRFFAYSNNYLKYQGSVKSFIDEFILSQDKVFSVEMTSLFEGELKKTLQFIENNIPFGFKKSNSSKSIPKVRFEAIAIGTNLALRENPNLNKIDSKWIDSIEFKKWTTSDAANNKSKVIGRIEFVRDCLLGRIDLNSLSYGD